MRATYLMLFACKRLICKYTNTHTRMKKKTTCSLHQHHTAEFFFFSFFLRIQAGSFFIRGRDGTDKRLSKGDDGGGGSSVHVTPVNLDERARRSACSGCESSRPHCARQT